MRIPRASATREVMRYELASVVEDRRFFLGLILQVVLVAILLPVLIDYSRSLSSGRDVLDDRASGFAPVGVWGTVHLPLEAALNRSPRLILMRTDSEQEAREGLESGRFCMAMGTRDAQRGNIFVIVNLEDPRSLSGWAALETVSESLVQIYSREMVVEWLWSSGGETDPDAYLEPIRLGISSVKEDEGPEGPAQAPGTAAIPPDETDETGQDVGAGEDFFSMLFICFGLFFPILSGSGMMVESLTGEKERRTIESLLASPVHRRSVLLGKVGSAFLLSSVQAIALLLLLSVVTRIQNMPMVAFCLIVGGSSIICTAAVVSLMSKGSKEANLALTVVYVLVFVVFFLPVVMRGPMAWVSPLTPLIRYALGDLIDPVSTVATLSGSVVFSVGAVLLASASLGRDDVVFGPRPSIRSLLTERLLSTSGVYSSRALQVVTFGMLSAIPAIIVPGLFLFPSLAILGLNGIFAVVVVAAMVEEYFKPYGIYVISGELDKKQHIAYGALAGLSFSLVENLLFTLALLGSGVLQGEVLLGRYILAPMIHMCLSALVSSGCCNGRMTRVSTLAAATAIHASYNLIVILRVL